MVIYFQVLIVHQ